MAPLPLPGIGETGSRTGVPCWSGPCTSPPPQKNRDAYPSAPDDRPAFVTVTSSFGYGTSTPPARSAA